MNCYCKYDVSANLLTIVTPAVAIFETVLRPPSDNSHFLAESTPALFAVDTHTCCLSIEALLMMSSFLGWLGTFSSTGPMTRLSQSRVLVPYCWLWGGIGLALLSALHVI
ncbi:hypothetical protein BO86DRAFT_131226 [Aspergillus japonicus CBS 114.51]|uniref:Uncharacterized protein n=1 Tax=Aspergillus japonicus CBS 114.51 TaxID=1448312 RepID=A0A8T8WXY8_ASPJA|nr:hypothetical protein BO86DRAFT_131226 [Aspergillus japonicus CBS 114.51]RAH80252.1 hypothetical protein BO86DRAFT_131226 [Aspergillus japonicus CBS 114.51]